MSTDTIVNIILAGVATIAFSLAMWILTGLSKRVDKIEAKVGENDSKVHARVDLIIAARMNKWLEKEMDCRREDSRITTLETILKERIKRV
jgi:hypothetical protein